MMFAHTLECLLLLATSTFATPLAKRQASCSSSTTGISAARAQQVQSAFTESRIVPDVVPAITPRTDVRVSYNSKSMNLGTEYGPVETLSSPDIFFDQEEGYGADTTNYTIIIVDPDAPGPELPLLRQFLHMITFNNKPSCVTSQSPKTLAPYMPLTPLSVANHRYTYLVYRQPEGEFNPQINLITLAARAPFNLQEFVTKYDLTLVGGNYMLEGLDSLLVGLVPGATQTGEGYDGPLDGTAEPLEGIGKLLGVQGSV